MNKCAELGLNDHVFFLGLKDQAAIKHEMYKAHIFLLSSIAEALPLVVMEASSTGMPVIATDVGSVREEIIDNVTGKIIPPANSQAITYSIIELLRNPEKWEEMGKAGSKHIKNHYDINMLSLKLEKIYCRLSC
jgi:glycosyltransferase involved in cell wall biosynthesis